MYYRAVARSENLGGGSSYCGGHNLLLVKIGLTVWPKTGGGPKAPPAPLPPLATALCNVVGAVCKLGHACRRNCQTNAFPRVF